MIEKMATKHFRVIIPTGDRNISLNVYQGPEVSEDKVKLLLHYRDNPIEMYLSRTALKELSQAFQEFYDACYEGDSM